MGSSELRQWVKQNRAAGYTEDQLRQTLLKQGYQESDVEAALRTPSEKQERTSAPTFKGYLARIPYVLFKPLKALDSYTEEEGMVKPLLFMLLSVGIAGLISLIYTGIAEGPLSLAGLNFLKTTSMQIALIFFLASTFHLLVKLFGGQEPYYQTFKAFAYISAYSIATTLIMLLANFTPMITGLLLFILGIWILILLGTALKHYTGLSTWKLVIIWLIVIAILGAIGFLIITLFLNSLTMLAAGT